MANETINREMVSTTLQENSKAEFNGWNLTFQKTTEGETISVSAWGNKEGNNVNAHVSDSGSMSLTFSSGTDTALAVALFNELGVMSASVVQEE